MNRSACIATLLASVLAASAAGAADQKPTFESLDKNGDGKVSVQEASAHDALFVAFKSLDGDKDGELTREEFERYQGKGGA
jgi:Ca2+-binding EF-hand superfamily protein